MGKKTPTTNPKREMSLLSHLDELRVRLIYCVVALIVTSGLALFIAQPVLELLIKPVRSLVKSESTTKEAARGEIITVDRQTGALKLENPDVFARLEKLQELTFIIPMSEDGQTTKELTIAGSPLKSKIIYNRPFDPIMMPLKVALILGILFSMVIWIWQIWLFIVPGLTDKEKRIVRPLLWGSVVLFPIGSLVAYGMFFLVIRAMQTYTLHSVETLLTIQDYLKAMTDTMIIFGFIFELPLVVAVLARVGIVTPELLRHYRRHIYVGLSAVAAVVAPADPYSMIIALVPMIGLFEMSIFIAKPMTRLRREAEEGTLEEETSAP